MSTRLRWPRQKPTLRKRCGLAAKTKLAAPSQLRGSKAHKSLPRFVVSRWIAVPTAARILGAAFVSSRYRFRQLGQYLSWRDHVEISVCHERFILTLLLLLLLLLFGLRFILTLLLLLLLFGLRFILTLLLLLLFGLQRWRTRPPGGLDTSQASHAGAVACCTVL